MKTPQAPIGLKRRPCSASREAGRTCESTSRASRPCSSSVPHRKRLQSPCRTARFCTVPRNEIILSNVFRASELSPESTFRLPIIDRLRRLNLHSAISTLHSSNPYCTAVFRSVPRNRVFSPSPRVAASAALRMLTFQSHHASRSERLSWGNQLVAGLGSPLPATTTPSPVLSTGVRT